MAGDRTQRPAPTGQPAARPLVFATEADAAAFLSKLPADQIVRVMGLMAKGGIGSDDPYSLDGQIAQALTRNPAYGQKVQASLAASASAKQAQEAEVQKRLAERNKNQALGAPPQANAPQTAASKEMQAAGEAAQRFMEGGNKNPDPLLPGAQPAPPPEEKSWIRKVLESLGLGSTQGENYNQ